MVFETLLQHLYTDYGLWLGGNALDLSSTYVVVKKRGTGVEIHNKIREGMEKEGVGTYLIKRFITSSLRYLGIFGLAYSADSLLGIQDNLINSHHLVMYLPALFKYSAGLGNLAALKSRKLANILYIPARFGVGLEPWRYRKKD